MSPSIISSFKPPLKHYHPKVGKLNLKHSLVCTGIGFANRLRRFPSRIELMMNSPRYGFWRLKGPFVSRSNLIGSKGKGVVSYTHCCHFTYTDRYKAQHLRTFEFCEDWSMRPEVICYPKRWSLRSKRLLYLRYITQTATTRNAIRPWKFKSSSTARGTAA